MSFTNFIAQIWDDGVLEALQVNLVYGNLFNDDYEGEIKGVGDTVRINSIGDITVRSYVKDTDINAPDSITDAQTMLTISQAKYFNFAIDDVDAMQIRPSVMAAALRWAGYKVALTMDQYYAGFYTDASNSIGSSGSFTTVSVGTQTNIGGGNTVYDLLVQAGQLLTQKAVPKAGRWGVIAPWMTTFLNQDIRFTSFNTEAARQTIISGKLDVTQGAAGDAYIGRINGMDVYESLNAPNLGGTPGLSGSQDVALVGHSMALTKAEAVNKTEAYRPPYRFSDAVKGLALYGARTVRPYALCSLFLQHP